MTLPRFDGTVHVGLEGLATDAEGRAASIEVHGQYVHPSTGLGGFVHARSAVGILYHGADYALGNPEAGGIYVRTFKPITIVAHVALSAPLAGESEEALTHSRILTALPRAKHAGWQTSWCATTGASALVHHDRLVARLDASTSYVWSGETRLGFYLGLGVGARLGPTTLMAELSSKVGAIALRGRIASWQPTAAVLFPLDERAQIMFDVGVLLGVDRQL